MDATARLLAPRPRMFQDGGRKGTETSRSSRRRGKVPAQPAPAPEKPAPRKGKKSPEHTPTPLEVLGGGRKKKRRRSNSGPREVELRHDHVKDSTELSASLMKPYYLSDD